MHFYEASNKVRSDNHLKSFQSASLVTSVQIGDLGNDGFSKASVRNEVRDRKARPDRGVFDDILDERIYLRLNLAAPAPDVDVTALKLESTDAPPLVQRNDILALLKWRVAV